MKIAIIGFGPRGLYGLESLVRSATEHNRLDEIIIKIFEPNEDLGIGKAWELDQPDSNRINISDFALKNLEGRPKLDNGQLCILKFPSYTEWCIENNFSRIQEDKDYYPERSQMGRYLNERANSIVAPLREMDLVEVIPEKVNGVYWKVDCVTIESGFNTISSADECLISIGHQPTELSEEQRENIIHSEENECVYVHSPYENYISRRLSNTGNIGIIGFGLTMIDITRLLIEELDGVFKKRSGTHLLEFAFKTETQVKIFPYSFDGLPCMPKPYGRKVDNLYKPDKEKVRLFEQEIQEVLENERVESPDFLLTSFAKIAAEIHASLNVADSKLDIKKLENYVINWLIEKDICNNLILDPCLETRKYITSSVAMAMGLCPPSLDFSIGQVWRHLQPTMYRLFSFPNIDGQLIKKIIGIDERTKRYSYGPPVESMLQLIALNDVGILDFSFVNDPAVTAKSDGWHFTNYEETVICDTLINSVLDAPDIESISSELIKSLKYQKLVIPVAEGLGTKIAQDGRLYDMQNDNVPISMIGRNVKGNVLGTDAILECFGSEIDHWAENLVDRI